MIWANVARAGLLFILSFLVWQNAITVVPLICIAFLIGTTEVVFDSTIYALVPLIVHKTNLTKANGNLRSSELISNDILARPLGGFLIVLGIAIPFAIDSVTAVLSVLCLMLIQGKFKPKDESFTLTKIKKEMVDGFQWLWNHTLLRGLAFLSVSMNLMYASLLVIQVLFVQEILGLDSRGFGLLISAAVVGGVVGSQIASKIIERIGTGTTMSTSILATGLSFALVGVSNHWLTVAVLYIAASFFVVVGGVAGISLRQAIVPSEMLGRVGGIFRLLSWGVSPIGMLLVGYMVTVIEANFGRMFALRMPYILTGIVYFLSLIICLPLLKRLDVQDVLNSAE